jgi:methylase of polypeptide subunit release factors
LFLQSSWFDALIDAKFDLIVSSPPTSSKATGMAALAAMSRKQALTSGAVRLGRVRHMS